jgi:hypothetical protein
MNGVSTQYAEAVQKLCEPMHAAYPGFALTNRRATLTPTRPREPFKLSDLTFLNPKAVLVAIKNAEDLPYIVINGFLSVESGISIATHFIERSSGNLSPWEHSSTSLANCRASARI